MEKTINRVRELMKENKSKAAKKKTSRKGVDFDTYVAMVEKKAYELFEQRGRQHGHDLEDWFKAQIVIEEELSK